MAVLPTHQGNDAIAVLGSQRSREAVHEDVEPDPGTAERSADDLGLTWRNDDASLHNAGSQLRSGFNLTRGRNEDLCIRATRW